MNEDSKERNISTLLTDEKVWSWKNTKIDLQAMHMDPLYSISSTSGLQLRKTFNFNHAIDYLAATTSFGGETFIAVQSLSSKSIVHIWNTVQHKNCKVKLQYRINSFIIVNSLMIGVALCGDGKLRVYTSVPTLVEVASFELVKPATYPVYNPFNKDILLGGISEVNVWCFREERKGEKKNPLSEVIRMNLERGQSFNPSLGDQWVTCITINEKSSQVSFYILTENQFIKWRNIQHRIKFLMFSFSNNLLLYFYYVIALEKVVIAAETLVSIVDANTYIVKNLIRTDTCSTITQCTLYNAMDYTITGNS